MVFMLQIKYNEAKSHRKEVLESGTHSVWSQANATEQSPEDTVR